MHSNGSLWKLFAHEIIKQQTTNTNKMENGGNGIMPNKTSAEEKLHTQLSLLLK